MELEFQNNVATIDAKLSYSFIMICITVGLVFITCVFIFIELRTSLDRLERKIPFVDIDKEFEEAPDTLDLSGNRRNRIQVPGGVRDEPMIQLQAIHTSPMV